MAGGKFGHKLVKEITPFCAYLKDPAILMTNNAAEEAGKPSHYT
ncbi:hypothetical protein [Neochlamydia sp. S13]|nr:hypothetical protein [Neochlamydia sp. S13]